MNKSDYKNMWVYIEMEEGSIHPVSLELCCEVRKLCDVTGEKLIAVYMNDLSDADIEKILECGVDEFIRVSGTGYEYYNTDAYSNAFSVLSLKYMPSAIFVGGTTNGRDFAPRFSVRINTGCTSDAMEVVYDEKTGDIEFIEPAVGGKIMAVITVPVMRPQVGTIRPGTFKLEPAGKRSEKAIVTEEVINFPIENIRTKLLEFKKDAFDPALNIADSEVIICVGNGLKDAESLERYRKLADLLGGKVAATRPLFDREILPQKLQVGQSGVMIKPKLYIGFGVSGAVNHIAGVTSDMMIAVNTDPKAQIFSYCDYGIVGDMDEICDLMIAELSAR